MSATRLEEILDAACRVIARSGVDRMRMSDVAREAGVSSALVYYYLDTRAALLAKAFEHAEARADVRGEEAMAGAASAAERLERLLLLYLLADESVIAENWVLWREMWNHALFEEELRPLLEESYRGWVGQLAGIVRDGQADATIPAEVDPEAVAQRLAALLDGLGPQISLGIIERERASELVAGAIARELGTAAPWTSR